MGFKKEKKDKKADKKSKKSEAPPPPPPDKKSDKKPAATPPPPPAGKPAGNDKKPSKSKKKESPEEKERRIAEEQRQAEEAAKELKKKQKKAHAEKLLAIRSTSFDQRISTLTGLNQELAEKQKRKYDPYRELEALEWIETLLNIKIPNGDLINALRDGVILCKLVNRLVPETINKIEDDFSNCSAIKPKSLLEKENIQRFLEGKPFLEKKNVPTIATGAKSIGVPGGDLFDVRDLSDPAREDVNQVIQCIYGLGRESHHIENFDGPTLGVVNKVKPAEEKKFDAKTFSDRFIDFKGEAEEEEDEEELTEAEKYLREMQKQEEEEAEKEALEEERRKQQILDEAAERDRVAAERKAKELQEEIERAAKTQSKEEVERLKRQKANLEKEQKAKEEARKREIEAKGGNYEKVVAKEQKKMAKQQAKDDKKMQKAIKKGKIAPPPPPPEKQSTAEVLTNRLSELESTDLGASGLDKELKLKRMLKYDTGMEVEAREWIEKILKHKFEPPDSFFDQMRNGILLCNLLNAIKPNTVKKIITDFSGASVARPRKVLEEQNLNGFLGGCKDLGVPSHDLFDTFDLQDPKRENRNQVLICLFSLGRAIQLSVDDFKGPRLGMVMKKKEKRDKSYADQIGEVGFKKRAGTFSEVPAESAEEKEARLAKEDEDRKKILDMAKAEKEKVRELKLLEARRKLPLLQQYPMTQDDEKWTATLQSYPIFRFDDVEAFRAAFKRFEENNELTLKQLDEVLSSLGQGCSEHLKYRILSDTGIKAPKPKGTVPAEVFIPKATPKVKRKSKLQRFKEEQAKLKEENEKKDVRKGIDVKSMITKSKHLEDNKITKKIEASNSPISGVWTPINAKGSNAMPIEGHAVACVGTKMLVFGGRVLDDSRKSDCTMFSLETTGRRNWDKIPLTGSVPTPRRYHAACAGDDKVFVFGGESFKPDEPQWSFLNDFYVLNTAVMKSWTKPRLTGAPPSPRAHHSMVCVKSSPKSKVIMFGGLGKDGKALNDGYILVTGQSKFEPLKAGGDVPSPRYGHACCVVGGTTPNSQYVIVMGGRDGGKVFSLGEVLVLDTKLQHWKRLNIKHHAPPGRHHMMATGLNKNRILVVGGMDEHDNLLGDAWVLTFEQSFTVGTWKQVNRNDDAFPLVPFASAAAIGGNKAYLLGASSLYVVLCDKLVEGKQFIEAPDLEALARKQAEEEAQRKKEEEEARQRELEIERQEELEKEREENRQRRYDRKEEIKQLVHKQEVAESEALVTKLNRQKLDWGHFLHLSALIYDTRFRHYLLNFVLASRRYVPLSAWQYQQVVIAFRLADFQAHARVLHSQIPSCVQYLMDQNVLVAGTDPSSVQNEILSSSSDADGSKFVDWDTFLSVCTKYVDTTEWTTSFQQITKSFFYLNKWSIERLWLIFREIPLHSSTPKLDSAKVTCSLKDIRTILVNVNEALNSDIFPDHDSRWNLDQYLITERETRIAFRQQRRIFVKRDHIAEALTLVLNKSVKDIHTDNFSFSFDEFVALVCTCLWDDKDNLEYTTDSDVEIEMDNAEKQKRSARPAYMLCSNRHRQGKRLQQLLPADLNDLTAQRLVSLFLRTDTTDALSCSKLDCCQVLQQFNFDDSTVQSLYPKNSSNSLSWTEFAVVVSALYAKNPDFFAVVENSDEEEQAGAESQEPSFNDSATPGPDTAPQSSSSQPAESQEQGKDKSPLPVATEAKVPSPEKSAIHDSSQSDEPVQPSEISLVDKPDSTTAGNQPEPTSTLKASSPNKPAPPPTPNQREPIPRTKASPASKPAPPPSRNHPESTSTSKASPASKPPPTPHIPEPTLPTKASPVSKPAPPPSTNHAVGNTTGQISLEKSPSPPAPSPATSDKKEPSSTELQTKEPSTQPLAKKLSAPPTTLVQAEASAVRKSLSKESLESNEKLLKLSQEMTNDATSQPSTQPLAKKLSAPPTTLVQAEASAVRKSLSKESLESNEKLLKLSQENTNNDTATKPSTQPLAKKMSAPPTTLVQAEASAVRKSLSKENIENIGQKLSQVERSADEDIIQKMEKNAVPVMQSKAPATIHQSEILDPVVKKVYEEMITKKGILSHSVEELSSTSGLRMKEVSIKVIGASKELTLAASQLVTICLNKGKKQPDFQGDYIARVSNVSAASKKLGHASLSAVEGDSDSVSSALIEFEKSFIEAIALLSFTQD